MINDITEAKKQVIVFCTKELERDAAAIKFLKIGRSSEGWNARVEVTEQNEYLKKLGYPPIFDRSVYNIDLDDTGNVTRFCQKGEEDEEL